VLWVRVDPAVQWFAPVTVDQQEHMYVQQLLHDKDIIAQIEAIKGLTLLSGKGLTIMMSRALRDTLQDERVFWAVREAAAFAMAEASRERSGSQNLQYLIDTFKARWFEKDGSVSPNDFSDIAEYKVKRAIVRALSTIQDPAGYTPRVVVELLLKLTRQNDNSRNKYSDSYYVRDLLLALGDLRLPPDEDISPILEELSRYAALDKVIPSHAYVYTQAYQESILRLELADRIPPVSFESALAPTSPRPVRLAAWRCTIDKLALMRDTRAHPGEQALRALQVLEREPVPGVRTEMAEIWAQTFSKSCFNSLYSMKIII